MKRVVAISGGFIVYLLIGFFFAFEMNHPFPVSLVFPSLVLIPFAIACFRAFDNNRDAGLWLLLSGLTFLLPMALEFLFPVP